jgi:hypothetical protein
MDTCNGTGAEGTADIACWKQPEGDEFWGEYGASVATAGLSKAVVKKRELTGMIIVQVLHL